MHPAFCERLVRLELEHAVSAGDIFSERTRLIRFAFPLLYVGFTTKAGAERALRFDCTDYDYDPVQVEAVDPETLAPLSPEKWLRRAGGGAFPSHPMKEGRPFLCVSGVRDFYTYDGHSPRVTGIRWEQQRNSHRIPDLLRHFTRQFETGNWE